MSPAVVQPQLIDLYCDTGQPEKALELIGTGNFDNPTLGTEPGVSAARQARVYYLLGYYENAAQLLGERAIPHLRHDRGARALLAGQGMIHGQAKSTVSLLLDLPGKLNQQASWELELGLCRLEQGKPELAAEPLTRALTLAPNLSIRPVAAYYLEKLGKPVPEAPKAP